MTNLQKLMDKFDISKINTLTKYPSILTYHNLAERGSLDNSLVEDKDFSGQEVHITEKIDGTNSRIVFTTNAKGEVEDYLLGSREDLLYAYGDRVINNSLGIVKTVKPYADAIILLSENRDDSILKPNSLYAVYGETYGGNINAAKQYTVFKHFGFRIFDIWSMDVKSAEEILENEIAKISIWRETSGQPFFCIDDYAAFANEFYIPTVPFIKMMSGDRIPKTLAEVYEWLQEFSSTKASLDYEFRGGKAEGVVVRTSDRKLIRKIRFEDYEKSKRLKKF